MTLTVGVLALQGAFLEHLVLLRRAATELHAKSAFEFTEVRNVTQLAQCDALIIPGGESTTISFVAAQSNLLEPLRDFVKYAASYHFQRLRPSTDRLPVFQSQPETNLGNMRGLDFVGRGRQRYQERRTGIDWWSGRSSES